MKNWILIAGMAALILLAAYFFWPRTNGAGCPPPRNPDKFPEPWSDSNRNSGLLNELAGQYSAYFRGQDQNYNGSVVGGFFKGIDVFPSGAAAQFYEPHLINFIQSNNALPWWNMQRGELLCSTTA